MSKTVQVEVIEQRIFLVRGQKVMLSPHLAELYEAETRTLIQSVKRNIDRFPEDFMFPLTKEEIKRISQFVTSLKFSRSPEFLPSRRSRSFDWRNVFTGDGHRRKGKRSHGGEKGK